MNKKENTSWEGVSQWYDRIVGEQGHYFHQKIILPGVLRLLDLKPNSSLLDLGCGQGILEKHIPKDVRYLGVDISSSFIKEAKRHAKSPKHTFLCHDLSKPLTDVKETFSHAVMILCLQNMEFPDVAIKSAKKLLEKNGKLLLILNHPCYRIPRQSGWEEDEQNKMIYRRVNRYMTTMKIPIYLKPGQEEGPKTFSFHYSLTTLFSFLTQEQFAVTKLEEWCSDKESTGKRAKAENLARKEFPLFLAILASSG
ncbi:MAG TPA: methyltransferase domain-containing protein [Chlamydiales bacterium]|nr:methyltransferase domain-containing protein [Chlamydiales bacterium]